MARVRTVSVRVTAEVSDLEKKLRSVQKTLSKTGEKFKSVGASLTKAITVPLAGVATAAGFAINAASDLGETQSKVGELFGESANKINEWATTAATAFGQSKQQAMDAAANFAIFGSSAGLAGNELVTFSTDMTELASDLASFNNTSPEEAINAIGSALRGEAEPLRKYGVLLDDATMRQTAMRMGLIKTTKDALTPQQKVLAAQRLILQQTGSAQGDFTRTSDQLANQQRILSAQLKDTATEAGTALLPIALELAKVFRDKVVPIIQRASEWFKNLSPETVRTAAKIGLVVAAIGPLILGIGIGIKSLGTLITVVKSLGIALQFLAMNPIGLIITGIGLLVAAGIYMYKNWDTVRINFLKIFDAMALGAQTAMSWIKIKVLQGIDLILAGYEKLYGFIPGLGDLISTARSKISNLIDEEKIKQSTRVMKSAMKQASYAVQLQEIKLKKLEGANEDTTKAVQELAEAKEYETEVMNKSVKATEDAAEAQKKLREANIKMLDTLGGAVIKALRDRYTNEEKLQTKSLTKQSNALKRATEDNLRQYNKEYLAKLKVFNAETDAELIALQKQIDAIDGKTDAEEKALKEQEYQTRLTAKQKELSEAESAEEKLKITTELNTMIADRQREHLLESRAAEKESLRLQMDEVRNNAELKREAMELELDEKILHEQELSDAKLKSLDDEMESVKNHFAALTTEEALQAEARLLVLDKNNQEIIDLLETYNADWQNAGQSFGESLLDGLNSKKQSIQSAVNDIMSLVKSAQSAVVPAPSPAQSDGGEKAKSYIVKAGDTLSAIASRLGSSVAKIAGASGVKNVDLIHPGQRLTIPKLATGTNNVPQDMLAMLHKGEGVVPKKYNNNQGNGGPVTIIVEMDGRQIARGTAPHIVREIRLKTGLVF